MSELFTMSPEAEMFLKLRTIAIGKDNPLEREYYVGVVVGKRRQRLFCFFEEAEEDRISNNLVRSRKRLTIPVTKVYQVMKQKYRPDMIPKVLSAAKESFDQILNEGVGPLTYWKSEFGTYSAYRALSKLAQE